MSSSAKHSDFYDPAFFESQRCGSAQSADIIVPLVLSLFPVRSVIDIGCGVGPWLRAFRDHGISDVIGLDGDYVERSKLEFPAELFQPTDLTADFAIARRFDLACSLEVAEHLPKAVATGLIGKLCEAAPVVLFSAAIPGQGGTGHVNEAWHDAWRNEFLQNGYHPIDAIRWKVWGRREVEFWYQQNTIIYVNGQTLADHPSLTPVGKEISLNVVHPDCYLPKVEAATTYLSKSLKQLPSLFNAALKRRWR